MNKVSSFAASIQLANPDKEPVKKEDPKSLLSIPPTDLSCDTAYRKSWTIDRALKINEGLSSFFNTVLELCTIDSAYAHWIQTSKQIEIANEFNVSQQDISRVFGPVQREYKKNRNELIIEMVNEGKTQDNVASHFSVSPATVRSVLRSNSEQTAEIPDSGKTADKPKSKAEIREESRAAKRQSYHKKDKDELIELLISRDEVIGKLKKTISDLKGS